MRVVHGAVALLFSAAALVQLNDPDPLLWTLLYGVAAVVSGAVAAGYRLHPLVPAAVGAVAVLWALSIFALGLPAEPNPMAWGPQSGWLADETVREGLGLLLVAFWMAGIAEQGRKSAARPN